MSLGLAGAPRPSTSTPALRPLLPYDRSADFKPRLCPRSTLWDADGCIRPASQRTRMNQGR